MKIEILPSLIIILLFVTSCNTKNNKDYSGKWIRKEKNEIIKIDKNGNNYIVKIGEKKYTAEVKNELLEINTKNVIKATIDDKHNLIFNGNEYIDYQNYSKIKKIVDNNLKKNDQSFDKAKKEILIRLSTLESSFQKRNDLLVELVRTVKNYADNEKETLDAVIKARAKCTKIELNHENITSDDIETLQKAQSFLSGEISKLMVVIERYPDLKTNQHFKKIMSRLEKTENHISINIRKYNNTVDKYSKILNYPKYIR